MACYLSNKLARFSSRNRVRTFRGRAIFRLLMLCLVVKLPMNAFASDGSATESLLTARKAVLVALEDNPGLAAMQNRYEALQELPSQVGSLPDPMININAMNFPTDSFDRDQEGMTQLQFGFSQEFPFPGKLDLKEQAATFDAIAAGYSVDEMRVRLANSVKTTWWQIHYLDRALETLEKNKELLRQFIAVAETKYETGRGLQQDILLAQLELSKLIDQGISLVALRKHQSIQLNTLMDRPASTRVALADVDPSSMPGILSETELFAIADESRPTLKEKETQVEAALTRLELAKKDRYPDFKLGVMYGERAGDNPPFMGGSRADLFSVMLGVKIPLYAGRKQSRAISQQTAEVAKNRYALIDEKSAVRSAIATAITDYQKSREQNELFSTGIIPQAEQTVQSMLAAYQVSEVDFLNLVRSQMTLFNYELLYWKSFSEANQALSRLEAAVGRVSIYE